MEFKRGAEVVSAEGHKVGSVDRVVMDPNTKEVVEIVVREGALFVDDKIVPVSLIASAHADKVVLRPTDLDKLPDFIENEYLSTDEADVAPLYWYPSVGGYSPYTPLPVATHKQTPEGTVALHEGARVVSLDGKHVGDIERVIVEEETGRATHFVLTKGHLFPEKLLLPMAWVKAIDDEQVQLNVETAILERVRPYQDQ